MTKTVKVINQITAILILSFCFLTDQNNTKLIQLSASYFNGFQQYVNAKPNVDSAFDCLRKLSAIDVVSLRMLLHDSFALKFIQYDSSIRDAKELYHYNKDNRKFNEELLLKIASDTSKILRETVNPIYLLSKIQNAKNDKSNLVKLTEEYIKTELTPDQFYKNKAGRYGLMIFQLISKQPQLELLSKQLFAQIKSNLNVNQYDALNMSSRSELDKRAWYRYIYASVNYIEANRSKGINQTEAFLKIASNYSPDLIDENHRPAYFYEMFFLFGKPKETFKDDFLAFLTKSYKKNDKIKDEYLAFLTDSHTDKRKALSTLLQMALIEPRYKDKLRKFYNDNKLLTKNFKDYWTDAIDSSAKKAPNIVLQQLDNKVFSSNSLLGKWVVVDFWGTWCRPCRKEHPDLQRYYDSVIVKKSKSITLITIACRDTEPNVLRYIKENNYSFPVAMSDINIEEKFTIQGYPTKILITPKGKYITIPFGIDWIGFIKQYTDI